MKIAVDLEREHALVLLRFLRRVGKLDIKYVLDGAGEELECFEEASERLRLALKKALQ